MDKKNTAIGVALILLGISIYVRSFNISTGSLITLYLGLGLLFAYHTKKEQPFMIFGGIFAAIGIMAILKDIRLFRIDMTFETMLIAIGVIFIILYYSKQVQGFIIPGMLLPALGLYMLLLKSFDDRYVSSSIFLLLGFAFYAIYFAAYIGSSSWPLYPATLLLVTGILSYAFSFKVLTWRMIYLKGDYLWPLVMVAGGALILYNRLRKRG